MTLKEGESLNICIGTHTYKIGLIDKQLELQS